MDYKTTMRFLRINFVWKHWFVNDIALVNATTFTAYDDTNRLLTLLRHYVCFQKKKKKRKEKNKKRKKERKKEKKKKRKSNKIKQWILLLYSFLVSLLFSNDTSRPLYTCTCQNTFFPCTAPTRVEFLFRVLLGIGELFRVVTPHSSVPLGITSRLVFSRLFDLRGLLSDYTSLCNVQKLWRWEAKT